MELTERLDNDLKAAMKARDQLSMDAIRMIKAALLNKEIELKKVPDEAEAGRVLLTLAKQRKESAEQYQKFKRPQQAEKELKELAIIESYLPKALDADQIAAAVDRAIEETGAAGMKDMGKVMKAAQARLAGQPIDGKALSDLVKAKLQG